MSEELGTTYEMVWNYKFAPEHMRKECWVQALRPKSGVEQQSLLVGIHTHNMIVRFVSPLPETNGASWDLINKMLDLKENLEDTNYTTFDDFINDILVNGDYEDSNGHFDEKDEPNMCSAAEFVKDVGYLLFRHCERFHP